MKLQKTENKPGVVIIEGHIQGLSNARSLGEYDIPVYVVDKSNCIARYSKFCRKFFYCPDYIKDEFADFLIDLAESEELSGWSLLPSNDHAVITISKNKKRLEEYYKVITPDKDIIKNIYDKALLLKIAQSSGLQIPETIYFETSDDPFPGNLNFPVVTKGREGLSFYKKAGRKAFYARNETELRSQLKSLSFITELNKTFTQEVIPFDANNKTVSFTAFSVNGEIKTYWMGIKLREHPIQFGTATFAESIYEEQCLKLSKILLSALNFTGVCEVEYLRDPRDNKYKLIEINARTWLWVGLAKECGIDYAKIIYDYLNRETVRFPENYNTRIKWRNTVLDSIFAVRALISGNCNLKDYFCSLKGQVVHSVFAKDDFLPSIMYLLLLPYFFFRR